LYVFLGLLFLEAVKDNIEASWQNALVVSGASHGVSLAGVRHTVRKQQTCAASTLPSQPGTPQTHTHSSVVFFTATVSSMLLNGALQRKVVGQFRDDLPSRSLDRCNTLSLLNQSLDWYWQN